jgi:hypothetical protein
VKHRKDKAMMEMYRRVLGRIGVPMRCVMEIGFTPGSLILWNDLLMPERMFGLDKDMLQDGIAGLNNQGMYLYAFDQTSERSVSAVAEKLRTYSFDLIIDDCSHGSIETLVTWEYLWPLVRHSGAYVIEDWPANDMNSFMGNLQKLVVADASEVSIVRNEKCGLIYIEKVV